MNVFDKIVQEAALSAKQRKEIPDKQYGLPEDRKFPLIDAEHVRSAIAYFHTCPEGKKKKLASRIRLAAKKFNVEIGEDSVVMKY